MDGTNVDSVEAAVWILNSTNKHDATGRQGVCSSKIRCNR